MPCQGPSLEFRAFRVQGSIITNEGCEVWKGEIVSSGSGNDVTCLVGCCSRSGIRLLHEPSMLPTNTCKISLAALSKRQPSMPALPADPELVASACCKHTSASIKRSVRNTAFSYMTCLVSEGSPTPHLRPLPLALALGSSKKLFHSSCPHIAIQKQCRYKYILLRICELCPPAMASK